MAGRQFCWTLVLLLISLHLCPQSFVKAVRTGDRLPARAFVPSTKELKATKQRSLKKSGKKSGKRKKETEPLVASHEQEADDVPHENVYDYQDRPVPEDRPVPADEKLSSGSNYQAPDFITFNVSVALPTEKGQRRELSADIHHNVADVTTNVLRTFTPYRATMSSGQETQRAAVQPDLIYSSQRSTVGLAYWGKEVSWWKYSVTYLISNAPEDVMTMTTLDTKTKSAVETAIETGLFQELLSVPVPEVRAVAVPGHELDKDFEQSGVNKGDADRSRGPPVGATSASTSNSSRRVVLITILSVCAGFIVLITMGLFVTVRRRRNQQQEVWNITMGAQNDKGQFRSNDWQDIQEQQHEKEASGYLPNDMFGREIEFCTDAEDHTSPSSGTGLSMTLDGSDGESSLGLT